MTGMKGLSLSCSARTRRPPPAESHFHLLMMLYNFWIIAKFTESGGGDPALWALCIKEAEFLRAFLMLIRPRLCPDTKKIPAAEPGKGGG